MAALFCSLQVTPLMVLYTLSISVIITETRVIRYHVLEEVPIGSRIGSIRQDSDIKLTYANSPQVMEEIYFVFLTDSGYNFSISGVDGEIHTSGRLDREGIDGCWRADICELTLDVAVQPIQYFQVIKVTIEILDINDNSPVFPSGEVSHPILESAVPGSSFVIPAAVDLDSPRYRVMRYELQTDDDTFGITQKEKVDGQIDLRLVVKKTLDREKQDQHRLKIMAFDGGSPPHSGFMYLLIPVMDSNDNSPLFNNTTYKVTVPEDVAVGESIAQVHATDRDIGLNGQITYSFPDTTQHVHGALFAIDEETGDISVKGKLDRETTAIHNLIITASDRGADSLPSETTVEITVTDINDNAPRIKINTLGSEEPNTAQILENAVVGTFVAYVSASDPDEGVNQLLNCSLNDYSFALKQTSFETEYQVVTTRPLDREAVPEYGLEIVCRDKGYPPQVAIKRLDVIVEDINDNTPVFAQNTYTTDMVENNFIGLGVLQTTASDRDTGPNGAITYTISDDMAHIFQINPHSGAISTRVVIDREQKPQYSFIVTATDHGDPPRSATADVFLVIQDLNDESPEFVRPAFTFHVSENLPERSVVGKLSAKDRDSPPFNQFMYVFESIGASSLPFYLNTQTGHITTRRPLDREQHAEYHLEVMATDQGSPPMDSTASITILVTDKNDNAPIFDFPGLRNNTVTVSNMVPVGDTLTRISAHDLDELDNARVSYSILRGNDEGRFTLDPVTGALGLSSPLSDIDYATFLISFQAKDHGVPSLETQSILNLIVNSSLPYPPGDQSPLTGGAFHYNIIVVVAVACGGAVVTVSLIVGILLVRSRGRKRRVHKYNCRMEANKMLSTKDLQTSVPEESMPIKNGQQGGLEITRSLSDIGSQPQISGIEPNPLRVRPEPWSTTTSRYHLLSRDLFSQDHLGRPRNTVTFSDHVDRMSDHSGDGSQDSGKGASEEGEMKHRIPQALRNGNPSEPGPDNSTSHYSNQPGSRTLPTRGNYLPPPPPPSRQQTLPGRGSNKQGHPPPEQQTSHPNSYHGNHYSHTPRSVIYPSGPDHTRPGSQVTRQPHPTVSATNSNSTPWQQPWQPQKQVIGESVVV